jgi:hypothetical protein
VIPETPRETVERENEADEVAARGLGDGIARMLVGAARVKKALTKKTWLWIISAAVAMGGGIGDRSQGFPVLKWALSPIIIQQQKQDSAMAVRLARIETKQDNTYTEVIKTQEVVDLIAKYTDTERRVRRELQRRRDGDGFFGGRRSHAESASVPDVARMNWDPPGMRAR